MTSNREGAGKPKHRPDRLAKKPIDVQIPPEQLARIDAWIASQAHPRPSRSDAILAFVSHGMDMPPVPPHFRDRPLTGFFQTALENRYATFFHHRTTVECLVKIDGKIMALEGAVDPEYPVSTMLAFRSLGAFRAACEHALAGQVGEIFPLARACIENAAYAVYLAGDETLAVAWLQRHESEETLRKMRGRDWHHATVRDAIIARSPEIGALFGELYQFFIDFGGHPNERGAALNARMVKRDDGSIQIEQTLLHGNGPQLAFGIQAAMDAGSCALALLRLVFRQQLGDDEEEDRLLRRVLAENRAAVASS